MTDNETANGIDLLQDLVARARKAGADAADAVLFDGVSLSHARRLGKVEKLLGVPATNRNWNTILKIAEILSNVQPEK